ncbi:MAG: helix-turn-helix transcriptional regulator [Planctomycetota bacterium]
MSKKITGRKTPTKKKHAEIVQLFAQRLRALRTTRGLTQEALARRAAVTVPYIGKLERAGASPGIDLLDRLAAALGVSPTELLPARSPDPITILREQAESRFRSVIVRSDRATLEMLVPWLAVLDDALARGR